MTRFRFGAVGVGAAIVALVLVVNCGDTPPAARLASPSAGRALVVAPAPTPASPAPVVRAHGDALAAMHARPTEWIGRAHNAALLAFAADLKRNGARGLPFCVRMQRFLAELPQPAGGTLPRGHARLEALARAMAAVPQCAAAPRTSALGGGATLHLARQASGTTSLLAQQYEGEMVTAINDAADPAALAAALNDVVARAYATLGVDEAQAIEAAASVGQSSYEGWTSTFGSYSASVASAYGGCFASYLDQGYSDEATLDACFTGAAGSGGGIIPIQPTGTSPAARAPAVRLASATAPRRGHARHARGVSAGGLLLTRGTTAPYFCGGTIQSEMKRIGVDDLQGAFVGGMSGILGGPGGIFSGAVLGGAGASMWRAGATAYSEWKCAMRT